jgi:hypothetical protein
LAHIDAGRGAVHPITVTPKPAISSLGAACRIVRWVKRTRISVSLAPAANWRSSSAVFSEKARSNAAFASAPHILADFLYQRDMEWLSVVSVPDADRESPARNKHPSHLLHGGGAVGKVLQPLLTQYEIETTIRERQSGRAALPPLHLGVVSGDAQHTFVDVDPADSAEFLAGQSHAGGARTAAATGLEIDPTVTLARFRGPLISDHPYFLAWREQITAGMRMAGVPEGAPVSLRL